MLICIIITAKRFTGESDVNKKNGQFLATIKKLSIFAVDLVAERRVVLCIKIVKTSPLGIKREPGENPGQSRCCKFYKSCSPIYQVTVRRNSRAGRQGQQRTSQKTCQVKTIGTRFRGKSSPTNYGIKPLPSIKTIPSFA